MKKRTRQSASAVAQLPNRILAALKLAPMTLNELDAKLEFHHKTIRQRLFALQADGKAHFVTVKTTAGHSNVWRLGPNPQGTAVRPKRLRGQNVPINRPDMPIKQATVQTWQANGQRDPFVAALFGPPPVASAPQGIFAALGL